MGDRRSKIGAAAVDLRTAIAPWIPIIFRVEVATSRTASVNVIFRGSMPFVPQKGLMVVVAGGDDYRRVEDVFYKPGEPLEVYFEFEDQILALPMMKEVGWKEEL